MVVVGNLGGCGGGGGRESVNTLSQLFLQKSLNNVYNYIIYVAGQLKP